MRIHRAKANESIYDIAREYGAPPSYLREINRVGSGELCEGREIIVPLPTRTYNVRRGETLGSISKRFEVPEGKIIALNPELRGRREIYPGQLLVLRLDCVQSAVAVTNGYCYGGCSRSRLSEYMPYLNFLTVCGTVARGADIRSAPWERGVAEYGRAEGKYTLLRIYIESLPECERYDFIRGAVMLAGSHGYCGITLGGEKNAEGNLSELMLEMQKQLLAAGLCLVCEGSVGEDSEYMEYADMGVLRYDKLWRDHIPSFEDGERRKITEHADRWDISSAFLDMSAFAKCDGRYISRDDALRITEKRGAKITHCDEGKYITVEGGRERAVLESTENAKDRLELIGELGFFGVSFDIMRVPPAEVYMQRTMLSDVTNGGFVSQLNCLGEVK